MISIISVVVLVIKTGFGICNGFWGGWTNSEDLDWFSIRKLVQMNKSIRTLQEGRDIKLNYPIQTLKAFSTIKLKYPIVISKEGSTIKLNEPTGMFKDIKGY